MFLFVFLFLFTAMTNHSRRYSLLLILYLRSFLVYHYHWTLLSYIRLNTIATKIELEYYWNVFLQQNIIYFECKSFSIIIFIHFNSWLSLLRMICTKGLIIWIRLVCHVNISEIVLAEILTIQKKSFWDFPFCYLDCSNDFNTINFVLL